MDRTQYEKDLTQYFDTLPPEQFEQAHCVFCGPKAQSLELFKKGTMSVHRCECWFVYNKRAPKHEALLEFYAKSDAMKTWAEIKSSSLEEERQKTKYGPALARIAQSSSQQALDIGCGNGNFLSLLKSAAPHIAGRGIDTNANAIEYAKRNGVNANVQTIDAFFSEDRGVYDTISLWGVLEHVKDPVGLLSNIWERLSPNGQVVVCVPNVESAIVKAAWARAFTFCPQHLWYFSQETLTRALYRAGFGVDTFLWIEPEEKQVSRALAGFDPYVELPAQFEDSLRIRGVGSMPESSCYKMIAFATKAALGAQAGQIAA